jgi:hypothetical protein
MSVPIPVKELVRAWEVRLFEHWEHTSFVFEDNPMHLVIGFSCACMGKRETSSISLSQLKMLPKTLHDFVMELRSREKIPGSPWHLHQEIRQRMLMMQAEFRGRLLAQIENLDHKLQKKCTPGRRAQLTKKRARIISILRKENPGAVLCYIGGKLVNF